MGYKSFFFPLGERRPTFGPVSRGNDPFDVNWEDNDMLEAERIERYLERIH